MLPQPHGSVKSFLGAPTALCTIMTTLQTDYLMVWRGPRHGACDRWDWQRGAQVGHEVERVGGGVLRHTHRREVATRCLEQGCDLQVHRKQDWAHRKQDCARVCGNANVRSVVVHCVRRVAASMLPQLSVNRRLSVTKVRRWPVDAEGPSRGQASASPCLCGPRVGSGGAADRSRRALPSFSYNSLRVTQMRNLSRPVPQIDSSFPAIEAFRVWSPDANAPCHPCAALPRLLRVAAAAAEHAVDRRFAAHNGSAWRLSTTVCSPGI